MINCEECGAEFRADGIQTYPGGTDPPGSHIAYAIIFGLGGMVFIVIGVFVFPTIMFALGLAGIIGALLSLSSIPEARKICERAGGGICPSCGHKNKVKWYS